ncbi:glycosyltransferase [Echinicola jeungdonensis]|uniref:Glycosyltransferase n=1 Tax=Echinicola jeungdonensis TaxID=709343 RepID=A0ABV5J6V6_9BACT|nr:glycosyltransferase [Echinicola jeungdonensis]MDN3667926.1 glycosyltransferase [Echinicola jeungdonensis]
MDAPLVTVICLCYQQKDFVEEALNSVLEQVYQPIELIVFDNGSGDGSQEQIAQWVEQNGNKIKLTKVFLLPEKINYCKAFNKALKWANGKFVLDLSGDDVLMPQHIGEAVCAFSKQTEAKVYSSNAYLVSADGKVKKTFFPTDENGKVQEWIPEGWIYADVVERYCVCTPTLVFDCGALKKEGGYDESLSYEDFDILVRMARKYRFSFSHYRGVKKRLHPAAYSRKQYQKKQSIILPSTLKVCEKISRLNQNPTENQALISRIYHETKHALFSANFEVSGKFLELAKRQGAKGWKWKLFHVWQKSSLDLSWIYELVKR